MPPVDVQVNIVAFHRGTAISSAAELRAGGYILYCFPAVILNECNVKLQNWKILQGSGESCDYVWKLIGEDA